MNTRLTRPKLDELWRALLALLESEGAEDAPARARTLAIAAWTGRPSSDRTIRIERQGDDVIACVIDCVEPVRVPAIFGNAAARLPMARPRRSLAAS